MKTEEQYSKSGWKCGLGIIVYRSMTSKKKEKEKINRVLGKYDM